MEKEKNNKTNKRTKKIRSASYSEQEAIFAS